MLFDLEDYRYLKIIGPDHKPVEQINWIDPYTTARATRDAYLKQINEYVLSSQVMSTKEEMVVLNTKMNNILESNLVLNPLLRDFFNAMSSMAILPGQAINEGDRLKFIYVPIDDTSVDWFECTQPTAPIGWNNYQGGPLFMSEGSKKVARLEPIVDVEEYDEAKFYYKEMTQALYDSYIAAFVDFQSKIKDLIIFSEGGVENFNDYVVPAVPAWDSYPELSGYVRGTNNLTIKDAVVRLVDADGANHDLVTDANGYYKFDKEMFYNNIAFDHGATASNFNMFVLEHTVGSTASLYDKTSIFQNSFFGAENNREFTWPAQVKMGKQARRNFKLEFKEDYRNYPSFSGYVKDVDGNPIKNAFVAIKDTVTGWSIGEYKKPSGNYGMKFTYDDFGTSRSILTDANGYYEYTSQMVGEWFNKELIANGYIYIGSNMIGTSFDTYFVNPIHVGVDPFSAKSLETNTAFCAYLVPYIQDVNNDSISWDGVTIYDRNEYSTSRFKYALNSYNEFFYQKIELNTHYNINVDVSVAVGNEVRVEKVFFKLDDRCKEVNGAFPITLKVGFTGVMGRQYSQSFKIVYPKTGESYVQNGQWGEFMYDSNSHLNINSGNFDDYSEFYLYSCDSYGRAVGVLNIINTFESNTVFESIDLSSLSNLTTLQLGERFYGDSIDLSEIDTLEDFRSKSSFIKNIEGLGNQRDLSHIYIENALIETLDITNLKKLGNLSLKKLTILRSLDLQHNRLLTTLKIINVDVELDVTGLSYLRDVSYDKLTLTSDDVDNLIIQIANNPSPYTDSTDWNFGHFIRSGNIYFYDENMSGTSRITRSSYSDIEYNILQTQGDFYNHSARCWNINLGNGFYPDLIEPKKLVLTVDPNLVDTYSENLSTNFNVKTSTDQPYWIGKLWNGRIVGYLPMINLYGNTINETFRLGTENATIEIYSCDEYGIPQGDITSFELSSGFVFSDIDTSELTGLTNLSFYGSGSIESLDLKSNINLETINLYEYQADRIDVTGLTSLKNINVVNSSLSEVIGFSTLSSLETIEIQSLPNLSYLSFAGLNNIRNVYINEDDLYDSTHVDTMLSELNANSVALIATPLAELNVKQAEINVKYNEKKSLSGIDTSFAYGSGFDGTVISTAIQSDGKIVVGGDFGTYNGTPASKIIRLNTDGSIDTSFVYGTGFDGQLVFSTAIQSDGKIVVGGYFTSYNGTSANYIIRLNSDGSIDTSFVSGTGFNDYTQKITIQSDGKILVGGTFTAYKGTSASKIIRLNTDGSIDTSFVYGTGFDGHRIESITTQSDGKIVVGGVFTDYNGTGANSIIRLNTDGSVDTSFVYGTGFNGGLVRYIAIQSDGKILVGGAFTSYNGTGASYIIRLNSDGSIDTSFVSGTGFNDQVFATPIQSDGKIVVGGQFTDYNGTGANYIIRLNTDGSVDTSFDYGTGFNQQIVYSTAIQSDGKILVGGSFTSYNGTSANHIVSLNGILGSDEEIAVINEEIVVLEGIITTIQSLINDLNSNNSGKVNTYYMARTSASDADYDSLIAFGWTLNLGGEFIYPYSQPVKGFMTIDWDSNENSSDYYNFSNLLRLKSTTGYLKVKSGRFSDMVSVNSDATNSIDSIYFYAQKGIMEFYSCDSHGRPAGNIIGFGKTGNDSSFIKSFDISNLTDIVTLNFDYGFQSISTIDLSSNINIKSLTIMSWYNLQSIVGFENLVNLKDIYMGVLTSLDIPVDFSSMVDLQRIHLYDINGINKDSRLNVSGLTKLQSITVSWTNILSVDLDNALLALDAAGLNSESDFNYEGHLPFLNTGLGFSIGMGIGYHAESASTFTSLQSKGWDLSVGDQIIDSVEEPTKGIARWGMETSWAALYFYVKSGMQMRIKNPNGTMEYGSQISFSFDSSMPEADRFFEFWAVDNYGRPRHDGITEIHDWWNTGVTSLEVNNITSIININIPYNKFVTFDISNSGKLLNLTLDNSQTLQSVLFGVDNLDIQNINLMNCPELDIDSILIGLDSNGSTRVGKELGTMHASDAIRTHASDAAVDSLGSKNWNVFVIAPAGDPITVTWKSGVSNNVSQFIYLVTTTGYFLVEDSNGSYVSGGGEGRYNPASNMMPNNSYLNISKNSNSVTFKSCTSNGTPSGEIVYIDPIDNFGNSFIQNINYSLYPKLKKISYHNINNITASYPNIKFLSVMNFNGSNNLTYDLSGCTNLYEFEILNYENDGQQRTTPSSASLELPSTLSRLQCTGLKLNLDSVPTAIEDLSISYGAIIDSQGIITGINVNNTDFSNLSFIYMAYCNSGIINLDSSDKLTQFRSDYSFFDSLIIKNLPKMENITLTHPQNTLFTSLDLSELGSSISEYGRYFNFDNCGSLTSVDFSNVERIQSVNFQNAFDLVSVDFTNTTWKNGGEFSGQSSINFFTANSLSEIIGLDTAIEYISDGTWSNLSTNTYHSYSSIALQNCPMLDFNFLSNTYVGNLTFYNLTGISNLILPAGLRVDTLNIQNSSLTSIDFTQMTNVVSGPGHMPGVFIGIPIGFIQLTENTQLTNLVFPSSGTTNGYVFTGAHPVHRLFGMIYINNNNLSVSSLTDLCLTVKRSAIFTTSNYRWSYMYNNNKPTQDGKDALTYLISQRQWSLNTNLI